VVATPVAVAVPLGLVDPDRGSTVKTFPVLLWTITSVFPFGVTSMPLALKPG
jgi:hypothetical protein